MQMNPSLKRQSKDFEAISAAFTRSLKSLEIEPARFRALPLRQRKLALFEAIYTTAKQVSCDLKWYEDRSDLQSKHLWDFTVDQIAQHQTIVDALIAFVCLGETSFIRPLVSYLSFPEPRWSILIDSVLRAVTLEPMRGSLFRIPNDGEIFAWRKWAIENPELQQSKDYSDILLSDIGMDNVAKNYFFTQIAYPAETSFLINRNEFFQSDWKYFDEQQASFCRHALYPQLKSYEFDRFAQSIETFVLENPRESNFNTLLACTNDWISEFRLTKSMLKQDWLALISRKGVSPRTGAILYQILVYPRRERKLAREFGKELLSATGANVYLLAVITDILTQSQAATAIHRIAKAYSDIDNLPSQTRTTLFELGPMASTSINLWTKNLLSREIESLCILGGEKHPKRRGLLRDEIVALLKSNDQSLLRLRVFNDSPNPECQNFAKQVEQLYELRKPLLQQLIEDRVTNSQLVLSFLRLLLGGVSKLTRLLIGWT